MKGWKSRSHGLKFWSRAESSISHQMIYHLSQFYNIFRYRGTFRLIIMAKLHSLEYVCGNLFELRCHLLKWTYDNWFKPLPSCTEQFGVSVRVHERSPFSWFNDFCSNNIDNCYLRFGFFKSQLLLFKYDRTVVRNCIAVITLKCSFVIFDWMRNLLRNWEIWQAVIDKEKIRRMKKLQNLLLGRKNTFQMVLHVMWILSPSLLKFSNIRQIFSNFKVKTLRKRSWWWSKTNWKLPIGVSDTRICILNLSWTYML